MGLKESHWFQKKDISAKGVFPENFTQRVWGLRHMQSLLFIQFPRISYLRQKKSFTYLPTHQNVLTKHDWVQKCVFKKLIYVKRWWRIRLYPLLWQFGKRCANISIEMSWNFFLFWFLTYWFLLLSVNPNKTQSGVLLIFK